MNAENGSASGPRVIAIGLEAMDPDLVERLCVEGQEDLHQIYAEIHHSRDLRNASENQLKHTTHSCLHSTEQPLPRRSIESPSSLPWSPVGLAAPEKD